MNERDSEDCNTYSPSMRDDGTIEPWRLSERDWQQFCADCGIDPATGAAVDQPKESM